MTAAHRDGEGMFMEQHHYTECGLDNIYLINGFEAREYEGETFYSVRDIERLYKAIALDPVNKTPVYRC